MDATELQIEATAIEAIARRVAQLLGGEPDGWKLLDAAAVAEKLSVERDWVYEHAEELGAIRLGGPRGRLRFDPDTLKDRVRASVSEGAGPARRRGRRPSGGRRDQRKSSDRRGGRIEEKQRRDGVGPPAPSPKPQRSEDLGDPDVEV